MCGGYVGDETHKLNIASVRSAVYGERLLLTLIKVNKALLIDNDDENKSSLHPFQEMGYGCRLNLVPIGYEDVSRMPSDPSIIANNEK